MVDSQALKSVLDYVGRGPVGWMIFALQVIADRARIYAQTQCAGTLTQPRSSDERPEIVRARVVA